MSALAASVPPPVPSRGTGRLRAAPQPVAADRSGRPGALRARPGPRLLLPPPVDPPTRPPRETELHALPSTWSVRSPLTEATWAPRPVPAPPAEPLPDPGELARAIVVTAVEALAGVRPLGQLVRWLTPELHDHLTDARAARGRVAGPVRRATAGRATVCRISEEVVEATVTVHDGSRVRAAAVRLEVHRRRWRACVLEIY